MLSFQLSVTRQEFTSLRDANSGSSTFTVTQALNSLPCGRHPYDIAVGPRPLDPNSFLSSFLNNRVWFLHYLFLCVLLSQEPRLTCLSFRQLPPSQAAPFSDSTDRRCQQSLVIHCHLIVSLTICISVSERLARLLS